MSESDLLVGFLVVVLIPLLAASWRLSLLGLAIQGTLLTLMANAHGRFESWTPSSILQLVDLAFLRAFLGPLLLYRVLKAQKAPARSDVLPPNLLVWTLAGALVLVAFRFGRLAGTTDTSLHLSVFASALVLGLFVLASQDSRLSQMIGFLRIENAIALFELPSHHPLPPAVHGAILAVFLLTLFALRSFLSHRPAPGALESSEGPRL